MTLPLFRMSVELALVRPYVQITVVPRFTVWIQGVHGYLNPEKCSSCKLANKSTVK